MHDEANSHFSQLLCESAKKLHFAHIMCSCDSQNIIYSKDNVNQVVYFLEKQSVFCEV